MIVDLDLYIFIVVENVAIKHHRSLIIIIHFVLNQLCRSELRVYFIVSHQFRGLLNIQLRTLL